MTFIRKRAIIPPDRVTTNDAGHTISVRLFAVGATVRLDCWHGCTPQVRHSTIADVKKAEAALLRRKCRKAKAKP